MVELLADGVGGQGQNGYLGSVLFRKGANGSGGFQAVHDGHFYVHQHEVEGAVLDLFQGHLAVVGHLDLYFGDLLAQELDGQHLVEIGVFDDQHRQSLQLGGLGGRLPGFGLWQSSQGVGEAEAEGSAAPGLAFHPDMAALLFDQLFGDGQAEAGAAVGFFTVGIGLLETLEDVRQLIGRNADAGVAHREFEGGLSLVFLHQMHPYADRTFRGELDGVADQVHQDLVEAGGVANEMIGQSFVGVNGEFQLLFLRPEREHAL